MDFVLLTFHQGPTEMKVGEEYEIKCQFVNPLPRPLTNCVWQVDGPGLDIEDIRQR